MLQVSQLSYRYPGGVAKVLAGVDLTVKNGEIVALVGQNGSGKSTLGRLIAGLHELQSGSVTIDGTSYRQHKRGLRDDLSIVFQNPENQLLFNSYDEEIKFALPELSPAELETRVQQSLAAVGMSRFRHCDLNELSPGQKQRLVIAEALARGAKHLILDEPTAMIDSEGKREIATLVSRLRRSGYAILYLTNLTDEILLADRTLILAGGRIAAEIKRAELLSKAGLLTRYQIELPILLKLGLELQQQGLKLTPRQLTPQGIARALKEQIHG